MEPRAGVDKKVAVKIIATNRKARHDYVIVETFEAGLVLVGTEVKSLRAGQASLGEGFVLMRRGEAWLVGVHIAEFPQAHQFNHVPTRERKLLLNARELRRLQKRIDERGSTCVPLKLYFKGARIKVEIALVTGKKAWDKREDTKKRDASREMQRALRGRR